MELGRCWLEELGLLWALSGAAWLARLDGGGDGWFGGGWIWIGEDPDVDGGGARVGSLEIRWFVKVRLGGLYIESEFWIGVFRPSDLNRMA